MTMATIHASTILDLLSEENDAIDGINLYAVLDAARNKSIFPTVVESAGEYYCLYRG